MFIKPLNNGGESGSADRLANLTRRDNNVFYKKVCVMGGYAVGKSSLLRRYVNNIFRANYTGTLGVHLYRRNFHCSSGTYNMFFWDLSGINPTRELERSYLHGAASAMIVVDMTRPDSLAEVEPLTTLWRELYPEKTLVLAANKIDAHKKIMVEDETIQELGARLNCPVAFTSAKTGEGVETAFNLMVEALMRTKTPCAEGINRVY